MSGEIVFISHVNEFAGLCPVLREIATQDRDVMFMCACCSPDFIGPV